MNCNIIYIIDFSDLQYLSYQGEVFCLLNGVQYRMITNQTFVNIVVGFQDVLYDVCAGGMGGCGHVPYSLCNEYISIPPTV